MQVLDGDDVVLEAWEGIHPVRVPLDQPVLDRTFKRGTTSVPEGWLAPECFVCGPRTDGLRICPQPLGDTEVWATVWIPDESVSANGATVESHIVWGVLDCPAGIAVTQTGLAAPRFFAALTNLTVQLEQPIPLGTPVAVFGWFIDEDERRINGGTAIVGGDGTILATGYAQHARLPLNFGSG